MARYVGHGWRALLTGSNSMRLRFEEEKDRTILTGLNWIGLVLRKRAIIQI